MARGGYRPGSGRPKQVPADVQQAALEAGQSPLDYMLSVMRDPRADPPPPRPHGDRRRRFRPPQGRCRQEGRGGSKCRACRQGPSGNPTNAAPADRE